MFAKGSRYEHVPAKQAQVNGRQVTYTSLRMLPAPPAGMTHQVGQGERLDQIAFHYYQNSLLFWHIADANGALLPSDLTEETGTPIKIPFAPR